MANPTKDELAKEVMDKVHNLEVQLAETRKELEALKAGTETNKPAIEQAKGVYHSLRTLQVIALVALPIILSGLGYSIFKAGVNEQRLTQIEKTADETNKSLTEAKIRLEDTRNRLPPKVFGQYLGEIASVDQTTITLKDGLPHVLAPDVIVGTLTKPMATVADLRRGMRVILTTNDTPDHFVTEIREVDPLEPKKEMPKPKGVD